MKFIHTRWEAGCFPPLRHSLASSPVVSLSYSQLCHFPVFIVFHLSVTLYCISYFRLISLCGPSSLSSLILSFLSFVFIRPTYSPPLYTLSSSFSTFLFLQAPYFQLLIYTTVSVCVCLCPCTSARPQSALVLPK